MVNVKAGILSLTEKTCISMAKTFLITLLLIQTGNFSIYSSLLSPREIAMISSWKSKFRISYFLNKKHNVQQLWELSHQHASLKTIFAVIDFVAASEKWRNLSSFKSFLWNLCKLRLSFTKTFHYINISFVWRITFSLLRLSHHHDDHDDLMCLEKAEWRCYEFFTVCKTLYLKRGELDPTTTNTKILGIPKFELIQVQNIII